jgi:hypothetical protein
MRRYKRNQDFEGHTVTPAGNATIQCKLAVGAVNDPLEHEADDMAGKVMRMPQSPFGGHKSSPCSCGGYDDEHVQLKSLNSPSSPFAQSKGDGAGTTSNAVSNGIKSTMGGGRLMDGKTKSFMESRFGEDFSNVKIHTGDEPAQLNRALNAKAFTINKNIYFNSGQYQPETDSGKYLLAHELTHVVQQNNSIRPKLIQRHGHHPHHPISKPEARGCCYTGKEKTDREIHFNLSLRALRIYTGSVAHHTAVEFYNLIIGPATRAKVRCRMYSVEDKQPHSGKGLINFVSYDGNFGFHSNFWRKKGGISRIPGEQSHGCGRLDDADASSVYSGDSDSFYRSVNIGDCVRVYASHAWADPTFQSCHNGVPCDPPADHTPAPQPAPNPAVPPAQTQDLPNT